MRYIQQTQQVKAWRENNFICTYWTLAAHNDIHDVNKYAVICIFLITSGHVREDEKWYLIGKVEKERFFCWCRAGIEKRNAPFSLPVAC